MIERESVSGRAILNSPHVKLYKRDYAKGIFYISRPRRCVVSVPPDCNCITRILNSIRATHTKIKKKIWTIYRVYSELE